MTTNTKTAIAAARENAPSSVAERLRKFLAGVVADYRARLNDRRMREKLADLPDPLLRDIGIAEEEIPRIRARERFTPRSWLDYRGSERRYIA
jgi:uncharacterized protein YjiS (DUF1127 family)